MQSVVLGILESNDEALKRILETEQFQKMDLKSFLEMIVAKTIIGYRKYAPVLRAAHQFVQSHSSNKFRKRADEIEKQSFHRITEFLLTKRKEIRHPDPETAIPFALMLNSFTLRELIVLEVCSNDWLSFLPKDDEQLQKELTRAILRYLGIE